MSSRYFQQKGTTQRHFTNAKTEIWVMVRFHMDLRELRNTAAASTESHQTQGFITLPKHFLSVLSFRCLKHLPACAVSMFPWMEDVTTANLAKQKPPGKWQHWGYDLVKSSQTVLKLLLHSYTSIVRISGGPKKKLTLKFAVRALKNTTQTLCLSNINCCSNLWLGRSCETELLLLGTGMLS